MVKGARTVVFLWIGVNLFRCWLAG